MVCPQIVPILSRDRIKLTHKRVSGFLASCCVIQIEGLTHDMKVVLLGLDSCQFVLKTAFDLFWPWGGHFTASVYEAQEPLIKVAGRKKHSDVKKKTLRQPSVDPRSSKMRSLFALQRRLNTFDFYALSHECQDAPIFKDFCTLGVHTSILSARLTCVRGLPWAFLHYLHWQYLAPLLSENFNHSSRLLKLDYNLAQIPAGFW